VKTLEKQLIADAALFDKVEPPRGFRDELSKTIRYLPPPAAPRRPLAFPRLRVGLAVAAAAALVVVAVNHDPERGTTDIGQAGQLGQTAPPAPAKAGGAGATAAAPKAVPVNHGAPVSAASALTSAAVSVRVGSSGQVGGDDTALRSEFVDGKLEQEWKYLKEDAKTFSSPFRSAIPTLYRHR